MKRANSSASSASPDVIEAIGNALLVPVREVEPLGGRLRVEAGAGPPVPIMAGLRRL